MSDRVYLDHNASSPILESARGQVAALLQIHGNASSVHQEGRQMRRIVEDSRRVLAAHVDCGPQQVVFTSGASEAAAQILSPVLETDGEAFRLSKLYVSAVEHPAILSGGRFAPNDVMQVPVSADGVVDLDRLQQLLAEHDHEAGAPMVAIMLANNETGVVQPVREAARITHAHGGVLVVDAVQGLAKLDISIPDMGADFAIFSSHKIGGPQGAGAWVAADPGLLPPPLIRGGGQENNRRAGTENVSAIAGFAAAIAEIGQAGSAYAGPEIRKIRDFIEEGLSTICRERLGNGVEPVIFGTKVPRLANTTCFAIPGISAETALISLDLAGIAVSSGSACSSGKVRQSHVLAAMGVSHDLAGGALRISVGPGNRMEDAHRLLDAIDDIAGQQIRVRERAAVRV